MTLDEMEFRIRGPQGLAASFVDTSGLGAAPKRTIKDLSKPLGLGRVGGNVGDILSAQSLGGEAMNRLAQERVRINESLRLSMEGIIAKEKELVGIARTGVQAASERALLNQRTSQSIADIATAEGELSDAARAGVNVTAEREALARRRSQILKDAGQQETALLQLERAGVNVAKERAALDATRAVAQKNYAARQAEIATAEAAAARTAMLGRAAGALGAAYMIGAVGRSVSESSQSISVAGALDGPGAAFQKARETTPGQFIETLSYATGIPYAINGVRSALNGGEDPAVTAERERRAQERQKAADQQQRTLQQAAQRAAALRAANEASAAGGFEGERIRIRAQEDADLESVRQARKAEEEKLAIREKALRDNEASQDEWNQFYADRNRIVQVYGEQWVAIEQKTRQELKAVAEREAKDRRERARELADTLRSLATQGALNLADRVRTQTGDVGRAGRIEIEAIRADDRAKLQADTNRRLAESKGLLQRVAIHLDAHQQIVRIEQRAEAERKKLADEQSARLQREREQLRERQRFIAGLNTDAADALTESDITARRRRGDIAGADIAQINLDRARARRQADEEFRANVRDARGGLFGIAATVGVRGAREQQANEEAAARKEEAARAKKRRDEDRSLDIARQAMSIDERRLAMQAQAGDKNAERMLEEVSILRRYEDRARDISRRLEDDKELTAEQRRELERQRDALGGLAREEINAARGRREVDFLRNRTPFATTDTSAYLTTRSNDAADDLARETRRAEMDLQKQQTEGIKDIKRWLEQTLPGLLGGQFDIGASSVFG